MSEKLWAEEPKMSGREKKNTEMKTLLKLLSQACFIFRLKKSSQSIITDQQDS